MSTRLPHNIDQRPRPIPRGQHRYIGYCNGEVYHIHGSTTEGWRAVPQHHSHKALGLVRGSTLQELGKRLSLRGQQLRANRQALQEAGK